MDVGISLPQAITAVAGLGTASFGLVDATKAWNGGFSNAGFFWIRRVIIGFFPVGASLDERQTSLSLGSVLDTLKANWINGSSLPDQKAIAKSLIKLRLNAASAAFLAQKAGVDPDALSSVAAKMASGAALNQMEADALGRFDLILTAALDEGYQRADQKYRNTCKAAAVLFAVALALVAGWAIHGSQYHLAQVGKALIVGLLATPLAPIAKDLSTAVKTASKAVSIFGS